MERPNPSKHLIKTHESEGTFREEPSFGRVGGLANSPEAARALRAPLHPPIRNRSPKIFSAWQREQIYLENLQLEAYNHREIDEPTC